MKNTIILIILSNLTYSIHAQNGASSGDLVRQYDRNTLYLKKGGFEKDGQTTRYGFLKKNLKKEFEKRNCLFGFGFQFIGYPF